MYFYFVGISNLQNGSSGEMMDSKSLKNKNPMTPEDKMEIDVIEGRMDIEKNDYGPTTSNPVHTPKPPHA